MLFPIAFLLGLYRFDIVQVLESPMHLASAINLFKETE